MGHEDGDVLFVGQVQVVEIGQLSLAGSAPGGPEVDEGHLAPHVLKMEGASVIAGQAEIRKLLAGLVADGGAAGPVLGGSCWSFGLGRGFGCRRGRRFLGRFQSGGGFGQGRRFRSLGSFRDSRLSLRGGGFLSDGGVQEVEPHQAEAQEEKGDAPEDPAALFALLLRVRLAVCQVRPLQGDPARLHGDGLLGAVVDALGAVDALVVAHVADVHPAGAHAGPAVVAAALIHLNADDVEPAEQAVDRPQGAEKAAEAPVAEDAAQADHHQDDPFPGKQDAQHAVIIRPGGVGQMADRPLEGARRADVLAEGRQGQVVPQAVPQGDGDHEHRQDHVFEPGQGPGHAALADLQGGDFVQQLLDQA